MKKDSTKTKLIISSVALALSLVFCIGAVYAWFAARSYQTINPNIELRDSVGASLSVYVYKYNENLRAAGNILKEDAQMLADEKNYEPMTYFSATIAPGIPVYFMIKLEGPKIDINTQPQLELTFSGIKLSSYEAAKEDNYDPLILEYFYLEIFSVNEDKWETYFADKIDDEITDETSLIYSEIKIEDIDDNSSTMFFRYTLDSTYSETSPTVIGLKKLVFRVMQKND